MLAVRPTFRTGEMAAQPSGRHLHSTRAPCAHVQRSEECYFAEEHIDPFTIAFEPIPLLDFRIEPHSWRL
jgi:hypothetical protein